MIVTDGSALVFALADTTTRGASARALLSGGAAGPHLIDAEVGQAVRALVLRKAVSDELGRHMLDQADALVTRRFRARALRERAWELRGNASFYDGLDVALAERLSLTLVTADKKLERADGPRCSFLVV